MRSRPLVTGLLIGVLVLGMLATLVSASETPEYEAYVVSQHQTLATIAADYGIPVETLARYNRLTVDTPLAPGQVLMVPITAQLAPQLTGAAQEATASTPKGEVVSGVVGAVSAKKTQILDAPGRGKPLFSNAPNGTRLLVLGQADGYYAVLMSDGSTGWVQKGDVSLTDTTMSVTRPLPPAPAPGATAGNMAIIETAKEYLGTPYQYGGRLPATVDCSLLVQTVFARHGIRLPRTAAQQYGVGQPVEVADLQAGDRLYFYSKVGGSFIGHTGLYIGDGRFIHASSNRGQVAIDELATPSYWKKYAGARR